MIDDTSKLPSAPVRVEIQATHSGYVTQVAAREIGLVCMMLGAGRERVDSIIDHSVGVILQRKLGDSVTTGDSLATVHASRALEANEPLLSRLRAAFTIEAKPVDPPHLIIERMG